MSPNLSTYQQLIIITPTSRLPRQLCRTQESHFTQLATCIQTAHDAQDYKLYYKLANLVSLPERKESSLGYQYNTEGQQMCNKDKSLPKNAAENRTRWMEHWMELFNKPGEIGHKIFELLADQRLLNIDILDTPFTMEKMLPDLL